MSDQTVPSTPEYDPRRLDEAEEMLRKPNLCSTLELLTPLAIFTDPVTGMSPPNIAGPVEPAGNSIAVNLRERLHLWHAAYFAKVALQRSNPHRNGALNSRQLLQIIDLYNQYDMPLPSDATDEEHLQVLIRLAYQQFPYQSAWWSRMNAAQFMYGKGSQTYALRLHELVTDLFGVDYDMLLDICICLYMAVHNWVMTHRPSAFAHDDFSRFLPWYDPEILRSVVGAISQTQQEFRTACEATENSDRDLRKFDFNPLLSKPVIGIGSKYYIPIPAMIPLWVTEGIEYRLSEYARDAGKDGTFFNEFGAAFEGFVADLLDRSGRRYVPEVKRLVKNLRQPSADFVLLEDNRALIIECKTRRRTVKHRYGTIQAIDEDYSEVIYGLRQCISTKELIRSGTLRSPQFPELDNVSEFLYVIVTLEDFYLANSCLMQDRVRNTLGENIDYQVLSVRELELMLANLNGQNLMPLIAARLVQRNPRPITYKDYLYDLICEQGKGTMKDPSKEITLALMQRLRDRVSGLPHR